MEHGTKRNLKTKDYFVFTFDSDDIDKQNNRQVRFSNKVESIREIDEQKNLEDEFDEVFDKESGEQLILNNEEEVNETRRMRSAMSDEVQNERKRLVESISIEKHGGLFNKRVFGVFALWYLFSAFALFSNKNILTKHDGDPVVLATVQMAVTSCLGFLQIKLRKRWKNCCSRPGSRHKSISEIIISRYKFWIDVSIVGALRLLSIILCLVALKYSSVSFVETIKSSSPLFTVIISRFIINEFTGFWTKISLFPIMLGLILCSSFEMNFNILGFFAAIFTNLSECSLSVVSKLLLSGKKDYKYTPIELLVFTSFTSCVALIPISLYGNKIEILIQSFPNYLCVLYVLNGIVYHMQTFFAFTLMSYISPVTYSVTNTLKRVLLIVTSIIIFKNEITNLSAFGSFITISSVIFYNHVSNVENKHSRGTYA